MKKILSILGAVTLTATGASSVVACKKPKLVKQYPKKPKTVESDNDTKKLIEDINKEKQSKMKYFNELNNRIQNYRTEVAKNKKILESRSNDLDTQATSIKQEIQQLEQQIEELNNKVAKTGGEALELGYKKQIKVTENNKNNKILEIINEQLSANKTEIKKMLRRLEQEKFDISEINSISSPTKIIVPTTQVEKNKIYVMEKDIKKIVLKELQKKINNNLTLYDFIIEVESKYINHTGTIFIELSHPKTVKIKIHGRHNTVGETNWININLPKAATV